MILIKSMKYVIKVYLQSSGKAPYSEWVKSLDGAIRSRITARIARFEDGNFGDHKAVGNGIFEARFFFGSGYRVFYSIHEQEIVLLLTGGDKATQDKDIEQAQGFLKDYLEVSNANKKS